MKLQPRLTPLEMTGCIAVATVTALVLILILQAISRPSEFETRVSNMGRDLDQNNRLRGQRPGAPRYVACAHSEIAAAQVRSNLLSLAARNQLSSPAIKVEARDSSDPRLEVLQIRLEAVGDYASVIKTIGSLEEAIPTLFIDTVDLRSQTASVSLRLTGQTYCSVDS
jgi:hypothetical protein